MLWSQSQLLDVQAADGTLSLSPESTGLSIQQTRHWLALIFACQSIHDCVFICIYSANALHCSKLRVSNLNAKTTVAEGFNDIHWCHLFNNL